MPSKKNIILVALIAGFTLAGCQAGDGNLYGYDFETAKLTYQISGTSSGTSEVLIKGEKKMVHNQIKQTMVNGESVDIDTIFIQNGPKLYTLDVRNKTGSVLTTPLYAELQKLSVSERKIRMTQDSLRDTRTPEEQAQSPLKPEKTETVAGQTCELYRNNNLETCLWQGIPLRTVASLPEYAVETTTVASTIELNQSVSDSEFDVPQGYQITELN